jgi:hypothetical protein
MSWFGQKEPPAPPQPQPQPRLFPSMRAGSVVGNEVSMQQVRGLVDQMQFKMASIKEKSSGHVEQLVVYIEELQKLRAEVIEVATSLDNIYAKVDYELKLLDNMHGYYSRENSQQVQQQEQAPQQYEQPKRPVFGLFGGVTQ